MYIKFINSVIAAVSVTILLSILRYYTKKKFIPIKNNILFYSTLKTGFAVSFLNLISILSGIMNFSVEFHYMVNVLYLCLYEVLYILVAKYILWNCLPHGDWIDSLFFKSLPFVVSSFSALLMWNNDHIFIVTRENTFHFGELYYILIIPPMALILFSLCIFMVQRFRTITTRDKSILSSVIILIGGFFFNTFYPDILFMDFFICFSLVIFYIGTESPEHFMSDMACCYNTKAFDALVNEFLEKDIVFHVYGLEIQNYSTIRRRCGTQTLATAISNCSTWLESWFPDGYVFYTGDNRFNIVSYKEMNYKKYKRFFQESKNISFDNGDGHNVYFVMRHIDVDCRNPLCTCSADILNGEIIAIDAASCRNQILRVNDKVYRTMAHERKIHSIVEKALKNDSLKIYLQPIYKTASKHIEGAEILARIHDDEYGVIMPCDFIPLAEKSNMIISLSYLIFEKTCQYISANSLDTLGLEFININCSPIQFQDLFLADKLKEISDRYGVDFSIFKFEVTESYISNSDMISFHIKRFKEDGAIIVMDDFGKGGSNLSRLMDFDFDIVKLDMSLVFSYFNGETL